MTAPWRALRVARPMMLVACVVACSSDDSTDTTLPYNTTFATVGDTVVASTTGDVPDRFMRHLALDWRAPHDSMPDLLGDVANIAVAPDGQVWVWDDATPALLLLDANGTSLRRISRRGSGPGEYQRVNDIAVARDGALVMWDEGNGRINFYNSDGTYRTSAHNAIHDCCGLGVLVDTQNRIWLTAHPRMIAGKEKGIDPAEMFKPQQVGYFRFDSSGAPIDTVMAPTLPGADGLVTALSITATSIGGSANQVPYGAYPMHAPSPLGHVVSAMSRPYAVHTESNGKHVRLTRESTPVPVAEEERAQQRAYVEFRMRRVKSDWTWNGPEIPREKPPINDLLVGLDGRIWVQLSVPSESFEPEPETMERNPATVTRHSPAPPVKFRPKEKRWDVFEPDGRYLGRIAVPREVSIFVARGNQVWGVMRDADDLPTVVRMRVEPGF